MLICRECGHIFSEEELEGGQMISKGDEVNPPEYTELVCPECGSDWWTEADTCAVCGRYYHDEDGCDVCPECQVKIVEGINKMAEDLSVGDVQDGKDAIIAFIAEVMA